MSLSTPRTESPTDRPDPFDQDYRMHVMQAEDLWKTSYPKINYMSLVKAVTEVPDADTLSGETGTTKFDPLWGEAVPAALGAQWSQPHNNPNPAVRATDPAVYAEAVPIHARIQRTAREDLLKKVGFDRVRTLLVTIPASLCDKAGINPKAGDRFGWDGDLYQVLQYSPMGWWMNTNTKLYVVLNCVHERKGS